MNLTRHIVLEGPDGSGKSTLFAKLKLAGFPIGSHNGGPPVSSEDARSRLSRIALNLPAVWDRCLAISDQVYRFSLREPFNLPPNELFAWLNRVDPVIVYCRPPDKFILEAEVTVRAHKPQAHVDKVKDHRRTLIYEYDNLMGYLGSEMNLDINGYDYTQDPTGDDIIQILKIYEAC